METFTIYYYIACFLGFLLSAMILRWIFDISMIIKNQTSLNSEIEKIRKNEERIIELLETQNRLISKTPPKD